MNVRRGARAVTVLTASAAACLAAVSLSACGPAAAGAVPGPDTTTRASAARSTSLPTRTAAHPTAHPTARATAQSPRPARSRRTANPTPTTTAPRPTIHPSSAPPTRRSSYATGTALAMLAGLTVRAAGDDAGYDRDAFAYRAYDFDHNGCDTRNDVLRRDLTGITLKPGSNGCVVLAGTLEDRYAGTATRYLGRPSTAQIDHVVPLADAWRTGASAWSTPTLEAFGNDPLNLVATSAKLNDEKSDSDASAWLPPARGERCDYVARQIAVKRTYGLWVTADEAAAMRAVLRGCPGQRPPTRSSRPPHFRVTATVGSTSHSTTHSTPTPRRTAPPTTAPTSSSPSGVTYKNCTAARNAGVAPLHRGDPGYSSKLDRDGDGVACE